MKKIQEPRTAASNFRCLRTNESKLLYAFEEKKDIKVVGCESIFSRTERQSDSDRAPGVSLCLVITVRDQSAAPAGPAL